MQNMYGDLTNIYYILAGLGVLNIITILIVLQIKNNLGNENNVTNVTENSVSTKALDTEIPNRQEIIAAVSAVIAEELGTSASNIRILSFKQI